MTKEEAIKYLQQLYPNGGHCWLDEQRIEAIGMAIQALQEEPKKCMYAQPNYTNEDRLVLCDGCEEECKYAQKEADWLQELHYKIDSLSKEDFKKVWAKYAQKEELVSEDLNTELDKYIKEHFTIDKEQLDRFGLEEKDYMYSMDKSDMLILIQHFANWQKENDNLSVSEDLEKAGKEWLTPQLDKSYANYGEGKMMELTHFDGYAMLDAIEFGAKWKLGRIQEVLLSEVLPCFMHGGEADEVVAKLEEVLNKKK